MICCLQGDAAIPDDTSGDSKGQVLTTLLSIVLTALMLFARQMPQVFIQSYLMYPDCLIDLFKSASIAQHTLRPHKEATPTTISSSVSDSTSIMSRIADAMGQLVLGNLHYLLYV
jgi:hypothetical protein